MRPRLQPGKVPLERALSKLGMASRSQARKMIQAGRVRVNDIVKRDPLAPVDMNTARITIDDQNIVKAERVVLMLHKPRGVVTTRSDEKGRPTVFSLVEQTDTYLHAVGRLDLATTGLLIITNDSELSNWLTDPANKVPRTYVVTVRGEVLTETALKIEKGIRDNGEVLRADKVAIRKASGKESHLLVTLAQGKNREIRRLFESMGHEITKLKRIAFGGLELGELPLGETRPITDDEIKNCFPGFKKSQQA